MDRRVQRTRQALHTAMLHSLAAQPWDEIHVLGLCERANVGRSTFYGHFPSREALLRDCLAAMGARFLALGQARAHAASLPLRFVEPMLTHLLEQRSTFHTLLARTANAYVHQQMQAMVNDLVAHELARQGLPPSWRTEALAHALGGATFGVLVGAIGSREPPTAPAAAALLNAMAAAMIASAVVLAGANECGDPKAGSTGPDLPVRAGPGLGVLG